MGRPVATAASARPAMEGSLHRSGFSVEIQADDHSVVLHLRGELDVSTVQHVRRALAHPAARDAAVIVIDLTELTFLDSTGIHLFLHTWHRTGAEGRSLVLRNPARTVLKALRLTGVDQLLKVGVLRPVEGA